MKFNQLRNLLAAPLAGLFLVLLLCVFVAQRPQPSTGLRVPMVKFKPHSPGYGCEDDRWLVIRLAADGRTWINETEIQVDQLQPSLFEIYQNRQGRVAYLMADPSVPYARVAGILATASSSIENLHVILLTSALQKSQTRAYVSIRSTTDRNYIPPCDMEWKENGYYAPSMSEDDLEWEWKLISANLPASK
jgi:Biopolymer transport protein